MSFASGYSRLKSSGEPNDEQIDDVRIQSAPIVHLIAVKKYQLIPRKDAMFPYILYSAVLLQLFLRNIIQRRGYDVPV